MTGKAELRLRQAEAEAAAARARLADTLDHIQDELNPANLADRAIDALRARGQQLADNALSTLTSRPIVTAILASIAGILLRRRPLLDAIVRLMLGHGATGGTPKHSKKAKPTPNEETDR